MTQAPDPVTVALTGQLPFILLLAAALALPVSVVLLKLYRRAVLRFMRIFTDPSGTKSASPEASIPPDPPLQRPLTLSVLDHTSSITAGPGAEALYSGVLCVPWQAAAFMRLLDSVMPW